MDSKHTPGPWGYFVQLTGSENHRGWSICQDTKGGWRLASVNPLGADDDSPLLAQGLANARLIAAAPELLAALEFVEANDATLPEWLRILVGAAIAKAKGA